MSNQAPQSLEVSEKFPEPRPCMVPGTVQQFCRYRRTRQEKHSLKNKIAPCSDHVNKVASEKKPVPEGLNMEKFRHE